MLRNSGKQKQEAVSTHIDQLEAAVARDRSKVLDWSDKAVQPAWYGSSIAEVAEARPKLDELSTPMMTLDRHAIDENLSTMSRWCAQAGLSQAPHGKTTMAPALWRDQLLAGCWAITVANEPQLRVARGAGVPRVIVANLFLRPAGLAWLAGELAADRGFEFMCWVDSVEAVQIMDAALSAAGAQQRVHVLIEVGHSRARTGVRSLGDALRVADAVVSAPTLALAGVAGFEGSVAHEIDAKAIADVDGFLTRMVELHRRLLDRYEVPEAVLSAGGSAFFDRVAAILGPEDGSRGPVHTRIVLRSGAYIVHDDGYYRTATPHARGSGPAFRSAMHVWARVISMPEPGIAYLDAGKRDLPFDEGLPELQVIRRTGPDGATTSQELVGHELFATNDQHAHVRVPAGSPLRVGDVVRLGLSHPCTAFDKWSLIPVLDDASAETPVVIDLVRTYF
jgi:D-serine deaminase-like pyridoxal phosphate-dependent protein